MHITGLQVFDCQIYPQGGWNPILVRIDTAAGISGWGEGAAAYSIGAKAIATLIESIAQREGLLLGRDPLAIQDIWQQLHGILTGPYGGGGIAYAALSAIDIALWDIKGKALQQPIYSLLGAEAKPLRLYANGWCYDLRQPDEYAQAAAQCAQQGFTALKLDPFRYHDGGFANVPKPGQDTKAQWLNIACERLLAVRESVGNAVDIILECHGKFNPSTAQSVIDELRIANPLFIEEPFPANVDMYRSLKSESIPLAAGERLNHASDFKTYFSEQLIAIAQPDLGACGGISGVMQIARFANEFGIQMQPHNANSPLLTAASLHADAAMPNFYIQECFPYRPPEFMAFIHNPYEQRIDNGYITQSDEPGLGIHINEAHIQQYARQSFTA